MEDKMGQGENWDKGRNREDKDWKDDSDFWDYIYHLQYGDR